jgi:pseudouridine-5'-phosphate glycosidase
MNLSEYLDISPEVSEALNANKPVVAAEIATAYSAPRLG